MLSLQKELLEASDGYDDPGQPSVTLSIQENYKARIRFSEALPLDDSLMTAINEARNTLDPIVDVHVVSSYEEVVDQNLQDWSVTNIDKHSIEVTITFKDTMQVSSGFDPDRLIVDVDLSKRRMLLASAAVSRQILIEPIPP